MFFYEYIKNPKQIGALCPSSKKLSSVMIKSLDLNQAKSIIEIGPGTGIFTKDILKYKHQNTSFFTIEMNSKMAIKLGQKFENLDIEIGNARNILSFLSQRQMTEVDIVISGIPWSLLKPFEQDRLLLAIYKSLKNNGYFATFAYILPTPASIRFRRRIFDIFKEIKISKIVWKNIPPAVVYFCKK